MTAATLQEAAFEILRILWWVPLPFVGVRVVRAVIRRYYTLRNR